MYGYYGTPSLTGGFHFYKKSNPFRIAWFNDIISMSYPSKGGDILINWTLFIAGNVICPIVAGLILHYAIQFLDNKKK